MVEEGGQQLDEASRKEAELKQYFDTVIVPCPRVLVSTPNKRVITDIDYYLGYRLRERAILSGDVLKIIAQNNIRPVTIYLEDSENGFIHGFFGSAINRRRNGVNERLGRMDIDTFSIQRDVPLQLRQEAQSSELPHVRQAVVVSDLEIDSRDKAYSRLSIVNIAWRYHTPQGTQVLSTLKLPVFREKK